MRTLKVDYSALFDGLEGKPDSYRVLADNYEWPKRDVEKHIAGRRFDQFQDYLNGLLANARGKTIVECGCGPGGNLIRFGADNRCIGLDFSLTALRKIRAYTDQVKPVGADIRYLPLVDNSADYVLFSRVLFIYEDLEQIDRMLTEARRILKPGGQVIVVNDYCNAGILLSTGVRDLWGQIRPLFGAQSEDAREFMLYYFSKNDMRQLLQKADMKVEDEYLCNVHTGIFHLTYHHPILAIMLRSLWRHYRIRRLDHWQRAQDARHVNDAYPLNILGRLLEKIIRHLFPSLAALSLCNLASKPVDKAPQTPGALPVHGI